MIIKLDGVKISRFVPGEQGYAMLLRIFIISLALYTVRSQKPSPCPDILTYEPRNSENDRWNGVINIRAREKYKGIWLSIILDRPADLLGNAFGDVSSINNKEYLIKNRDYILEEGTMTPIGFFVKYNAASIIPSVMEINLNGRTICSDDPQQTVSGNARPSSRPTTRPNHGSSPTSRPVSSGYGRPNSATSNTRPNTGSLPTTRPVTSVNGRPSSSTATLSSRPNQGSSSNGRPSGFTDNYTYSRPEVVNPDVELIDPEELENNYNSFSAGGNNLNRPIYGNERPSSVESPEDDTDFFTGDFSGPLNNRPGSNSPSQTSTKQECGTVVLKPRPLILNGQHTEPGQYPWHAALYHTKGTQFQYICGGNLISNNHILTAGHCVTKPRTNRLINSSNISVYLGKHNLRKFGSGIQDREVSDIFLHPNYNHTGFYNDIAILRLEEPVQITDYVRPICLWADDTDLHAVIGRVGTVVGWGLNENGLFASSLMQIQMPIVSLDTCLYSNRPFFSQFTSENSFCAGFLNRSTVCPGDSGGGLVFPTRGTKTVWQIRGIVSVGVPYQGLSQCDPSQYVVFTDVAKHLDWLESVLRANP